MDLFFQLWTLPLNVSFVGILVNTSHKLCSNDFFVIIAIGWLFKRTSMPKSKPQVVHTEREWMCNSITNALPVASICYALFYTQHKHVHRTHDINTTSSKDFCVFDKFLQKNIVVVGMPKILVLSFKSLAYLLCGGKHY